MQLDKCVIMLAAVVFTTAAPADVVLAHQDSFNKFIVLLKRHLQSDNVAIVMKTLQSLSSIFARKNFGGIFVKHLGKEIMPVIKRCTEKIDSQSEAMTESDLAIIQECVKVIEVLAINARDGKKIHVISLLVQLLVRLLRATSHTEWRKVGATEKKLQEMAIGRLNAAASMWPGEFKKVTDWNQELKTRVESAHLLQSTRHQISMVKAQETKVNSYQTLIRIISPHHFSEHSHRPATQNSAQNVRRRLDATLQCSTLNSTSAIFQLFS